MKFAVLSVDADARELFWTVMAKIPQQVHLFSRLVIHEHAPPFHGVKEFGGVKTAGGYIAKIENALPLIRRAKAMSRIINDDQVVTIRNLPNFLDVARESKTMRGQVWPCARACFRNVNASAS